MKRGRRCPALPARLPDSEDILAEILLRLPPQPCSLPRAGLVCKRWHRVVTDPDFVRRFRARHGAPPMLGFFCPSGKFFNAQQPPHHRVPTSRFSLGRWSRRRSTSRGCWTLIGSRHGLVLYGFWDNNLGFTNTSRFLVVDPMAAAAGERACIANPHAQPMSTLLTAAVVSPAGGVDRRSFRLVMLFSHDYQPRVTASVYSSEYGVWIPSVATLLLPLSESYFISHPSTLVGSAVHWLLVEGLVIQFDLERHSLAIIDPPPVAHGLGSEANRHVVTAGEGRLGFAFVSEFSIKLWERGLQLDDAAEWVLHRTIQLETVVPSMELKEHVKCEYLWIAGFCEESNEIFVSTRYGVFTVHLESMQSRKVYRRGVFDIHPYSSF